MLCPAKLYFFLLLPTIHTNCVSTRHNGTMSSMRWRLRMVEQRAEDNKFIRMIPNRWMGRRTQTKMLAKFFDKHHQQPPVFDINIFLLNMLLAYMVCRNYLSFQVRHRQTWPHMLTMVIWTRMTWFDLLLFVSFADFVFHKLLFVFLELRSPVSSVKSL